MRKNKTNVVIALLILLQSAAFAQMNRYDYKRRLENIAEKNWYSIRLGGEILSKMSLSMEDVRIYRLSNSDTVEVPYVMESMGSKFEKNELAFEIINKSYDKQSGWQYFTLRQAQRHTVNRIELKFDEKNFDWKIDIDGSFDQKQWLTVAENQRIVRLSNEFVEYEYATLDFPASDYTYFRVTLKSSSKPVQLERAVVYDYARREGNYYGAPVIDIKTEQNKKEQITSVIVALQQKYAVNELRLNIDNSKDFYRRVKTYHSAGLIKTANGEIENWIYIGDFIASSLEPVDYSFQAVQTNKLKLEIINRNDQPLKVDSVKILGNYFELKSELEPGADYYLVYGRKDDVSPQYDVIYFQDKIPEKLKNVTLGEEWKMEKQVELTQPLLVSQWWLWAIMIIVILLIGGYSIHMLKGMSKAG
ncbi:DUF3999 family protein [bacterium]|nr:DUF3999 family protein [bacterium]